MSEQPFPLPPDSVFCPKCLRKVVVAATPNRVFESECDITDCPINGDPENKITEQSGTLISFAEPSEISQRGRIDRFAQWEKRGFQAIKADLSTGGHRYAGGPPAVRDLAWEWVRIKEATQQQQSSELPKPQTIQFSTGDRIAGFAFVGGLAGMFAGVALDHAYPDLDIWIWRAIFWPSTAVALQALTFWILLVVRPRLEQRGIKPKPSAILASTIIICGFVGLFGYAVTNSLTNNDYALPEIIPTPPAVPQNPIAAPPGQRPLLSSAAKFIFACYMAKQTAAEAAKQKAFLQRSLKQFGDQIGFDISMTGAVGGFRVTVEARTDEAKNRFLPLGVLPIVTTVFIDVQKYGPQMIVVARADLPKEFQNYTLITPNLQAPQIIEAEKQVGLFLGLTDDACHII